MAIERQFAFSRVAVRLMMAAGAAALMAGCSDASRFADNPFSNPFSGSSPKIDRTPTASISAPRSSAPAPLPGRVESKPLPATTAPVAQAAPAPTPVAAAGGAGSSHWTANGGTPITVASGETAAVLANRYGVPTDALLHANGYTSAAQVQPGARLIIPVYRAGAVASAAPVAAAAPVATPAPAASAPAKTVAAVAKPDPKVAAAEKAKAEQAAKLAREEEARQKKAEADRLAAEKAAEAKKLADAKKAEADKLAAEKAAQAKKLADAKQAEAKKAADAKAAEAKAAAEKAKAAKAEAARKADAVAKAEAAKAAKEAKLAQAEAAKAVKEAKSAEQAANAATATVEKAQPKAVAAVEKPAEAAPVARTVDKTTTTASIPPAAPAQEEATKVSTGGDPDRPEFRWPAHGRIIQGYSSGGNDGINIAVPEGTPVKAAEGGTVAYAGSELKGYGNLVLIRHPNGYVTAYAHNGQLDVKRGDTVKRGQTIAKSGQSGNVGSPQLHFELRKGAQPIDPTNYLAGL